jgi:hypothetical protein
MKLCPFRVAVLCQRTIVITCSVSKHLISYAGPECRRSPFATLLRFVLLVVSPFTQFIQNVRQRGYKVIYKKNIEVYKKNKGLLLFADFPRRRPDCDCDAAPHRRQ